MSDDWKPGDLAVCLDARVNPNYGQCALVEGVVYRVREVLPPSYWRLNPAAHSVGLNFEEVRCQGLHGFASARFRKIRPDEHEPCEEEFSTLIRKKAPSPEERHERILGAIFGRLTGSRPSDGASCGVSTLRASIRSAK